MNKVFWRIALPLLFSCLFTLSSQAQWYKRQYAVEQLQQLSKNQYHTAFRKSDQLRKTGLFTIGGSLGFAALGSAVGYAWFEYEVRTRPDDFYPGLAGVGIMYSAIFISAITLLIGIPPWLIGRSRMKQLERALPDINISLKAVPVGHIENQLFGSFFCPTLQISLH